MIDLLWSISSNKISEFLCDFVAVLGHPLSQVGLERGMTALLVKDGKGVFPLLALRGQLLFPLLVPAGHKIPQFHVLFFFFLGRFCSFPLSLLVSLEAILFGLAELSQFIFQAVSPGLLSGVAGTLLLADALYVLSGERLGRLAPTALLTGWLSRWLLNRDGDAVGVRRRLAFGW